MSMAKNIQKKIDDIFLLLVRDPFIGEKLSGEFKNYNSYHFKIKSTEYRIIYRIYKDRLIVFIVLIDSRENIYKQLKQRTR